MQRVCTFAALLLTVGLGAAPAAVAKGVQILPQPDADRTFQFTRLSKSFMGTPLEAEAIVPHAVFVIGADDSADLAIQVATMTYMVGQWSQEPGTSLEMVKTNQNLGPVVLDKDLTEAQMADHNLVVVGQKNRVYEKLKSRLRGTGSFIEVVEDALAPGHDVMFVSDGKAAFYLANKRLYFKSGAYKGFFSFVKLRPLIEKGEFAEALAALDDPEAVRGCGKPVILAIGHSENIPPQMMQVAGARNKLVFKDLRAALTAGDAAKARQVWQAAMGKCYACHQGREGVPRYRKFVPNQGDHSYHSVLSQRFGATCDTCHQGETSMVGYR